MLHINTIGAAPFVSPILYELISTPVTMKFFAGLVVLPVGFV